MEKFGGVECYVGTPNVDYPKDKAILFFPDVFGVQFINNQVCDMSSSLAFIAKIKFSSWWMILLPTVLRYAYNRGII